MDTFPIPNSGEVEIIPRDQNEFTVDCRGVNRDDQQKLVGFFGRMKGRFGEFRFEHENVVHPNCRFDSDSLTYAEGGTAYDLTFPIKILPQN